MFPGSAVGTHRREISIRGGKPCPKLDTTVWGSRLLRLPVIASGAFRRIVSCGASKPATHRRLKTGHQVGGTGWRNRLLRTYLQGVSVQFVPSVPVFRSAAASPPRNRRAFPVGTLTGFDPAAASAPEVGLPAGSSSGGGVAPVVHRPPPLGTLRGRRRGGRPENLPNPSLFS